MKKIGIWGYFGYRNCGDDLLLLNVINEIRSVVKQNYKIIVFGNYLNIKKLLPEKEIYTKPRTVKQFFKFAFNADIIIIGPGGIFPSTNSKKLIFYLLITLIMKIRRRKIGYIGIGIGMFQRKIDKFLINLITGYSNIFISRSGNYLNFKPEIKYNRIILSSDMVFSDKSITVRNSKKDNIVVVALANIFNCSDEKYKEHFISEIITLVKHILSCGYFIKLIPFTNEIDKALNDSIAEIINNQNISSVQFHDNPYDTFYEVEQSYICIGMRFHALVMALSCGIPCLSISYSDKNEDVMNRFDLSDYSIRFGISEYEYFNQKIMIDGASLIRKFDNIVDNYICLKEKIKSHYEPISKLSQLNRDGIRKIIS